MISRFDRDAVAFISKSPTSCHMTANQAHMLEEAGFIKLCESDKWNLKAGKSYYCVRNDSALIAFRIPEKDWKGYSIAASHSDSPVLKLKENPEMAVEGRYVKLNTEVYGGMIMHTWIDRPLAVAGRLCVKHDDEIITCLVNSERDLVMIPSLAIHMDRDINKGHEYNAQKDMLPLFGLTDEYDNEDLISILIKDGRITDMTGNEPDFEVYREDVISCDLYAVNNQAPSFWGAHKEFMSAPGLDDGLCVYASLTGLLESAPEGRTAVHAVLDNEEVGSSTRQGAASTFLKDVLTRISGEFHPGYEGYLMDMASSFMLSADNAHAMHPNYPEKCDPVNRPVLGSGVTVKFSANQRYTTDAGTAAGLRLLADRAAIRLQTFVNRSDIPGGSTLGNISGNQVPVPTADIGIPQLAMHSAYETCGTGDGEDMKRLMTELFNNSVRK